MLVTLTLVSIIAYLLVLIHKRDKEHGGQGLAVLGPLIDTILSSFDSSMEPEGDLDTWMEAHHRAHRHHHDRSIHSATSLSQLDDTLRPRRRSRSHSRSRSIVRD